jgi:hypothetical protein
MFTKTSVALSVALVLGAASSALATPASKHVRHLRNPAAAAVAMIPPKEVRHSSNPAFDVYDPGGRYVGSDPDPFIRSQLRRDMCSYRPCD